MLKFLNFAILIAKSQNIAISIAKFQKYCNTLQYYWNHPWSSSFLSVTSIEVWVSEVALMEEGEVRELRALVGEKKCWLLSANLKSNLFPNTRSTTFPKPFPKPNSDIFTKPSPTTLLMSIFYPTLSRTIPPKESNLSDKDLLRLLSDTFPKTLPNPSPLRSWNQKYQQ